MSVLNFPNNFEIGELNYDGNDYFYNYIPLGLTTIYGSAASGKSLLVYNIANELTRNGNEVHFFTSESSRSIKFLGENYLLNIYSVFSFEDILEKLRLINLTNQFIIIDVDMLRFNNDVLHYLGRLKFDSVNSSIIVTTYNINTYLNQLSEMVLNVKIIKDKLNHGNYSDMDIDIIKNRFGDEGSIQSVLTFNPFNIKIKSNGK